MCVCVCVCVCVCLRVSYLCVDVGVVWCTPYVCVCISVRLFYVCLWGMGGGMHDGERDYVVYVSAYCVRI